MIRAVISDFGGVLTSPLIEAFTAYQDHAGISFEDLGRAIQQAVEEDGEHPLFELEKGNISEREFLDRVERRLGEDVRLEGFRETYFAHLDSNEPMIAYLRELKESGLRMAMLTNNVREWEPLWRAKIGDIDEIFEVVVDSAFVGMRKPERAIYELTLERMGGGLRPDECVFLDDLEPNVQAARALGMQAVLFETTEQAVAELDRLLGRRS